MRFAITGREFTQGENLIPARIEISGEYTFERTADGAKLTRQGDVQVKYLDLETLGAHASSAHMAEYAGKVKDLIASRVIHVLQSAEHA